MSFIALAGHPRQHGIDTALDHVPGGIADGSAVTVQAPGAIAGVAIAAAATPGALPIRDLVGRMKAVAGVAADDAVVVSQLAGLGGADPEIWASPVAYSLQCRNEADPGGAGIRAATIFFLHAQPVNGDTINIRTNGVTYTGVWGIDIAIGGALANSIANLSLWLCAGPRAANWTGNVVIFRLIDLLLNIIIHIPINFLGDAVAWGNAGMAAKLSMADRATGNRVYENALGDLVPVPIAQPPNTNYGWQRVAADLRIGETHMQRFDHLQVWWRDVGTTSWDSP